MKVQSLALCSGLRIWCWHSWDIGPRCGSDRVLPCCPGSSSNSTPSWETSRCHRCSQKKKEKKPKLWSFFESSCTYLQAPTFKHFSLGNSVELELQHNCVCTCWTWQDHTKVFSQVAEMPAEQESSSCSTFSSLLALSDLNLGPGYMMVSLCLSNYWRGWLVIFLCFGTFVFLLLWGSYACPLPIF